MKRKFQACEPITVRFVFHAKKQEFYQAQSKLQEVDLAELFQTSHGKPWSVYKIENLTAWRRNLLARVQKLKMEKLFHRVWTMDLDYKILSKATMKGVEKVLSKVISQAQTEFIKGRYIGQNVRLLLEVLEETKMQDLLGILLLLDLEKHYFDKVVWSFIQDTVWIFNFGESIKRWVSTFCTNCESSVINNGFCTKYFKLLRCEARFARFPPFFSFEQLISWEN